ncbi:hypothetical protein GCM10018790_47480 [Kitasatospora xanthocidica]|nr:hypothetical protein GCM10018790_47480 [Kitasatospora xanthocidica]
MAGRCAPGFAWAWLNRPWDRGESGFRRAERRSVAEAAAPAAPFAHPRGRSRWTHAPAHPARAPAHGLSGRGYR